MNRLTYKNEKNNGYGSVELKELPPDPLVNRWRLLDDVWTRQRNKLGELEDVEELCEKIVSKPIFEKFLDTNEIHEEDYTDCFALYSFKHKRIELYRYDFVNYFELKDYGITWALSEEELLKED